jgi:indolepyruvate ferredoxin oxidoreductase alpha subunit
VADFVGQFERVLVLEEPDACIELQIADRMRVSGRLDHTVPNAGELSPDVITTIIASVLRQAGLLVDMPPDHAALNSVVQGLKLMPRRPRLCPGCSHRSAFFTLKRTFGPDAIYPGDIGCYTLGTNLRAVDTCVDMGADQLATGFCRQSDHRQHQPIVATIGDSTFCIRAWCR